MKDNRKNDNGKASSPKLVPVHFQLTHPTAHTVSVAGCFDHGQAEEKTLHSSGGGHWLKETALTPGTYEYRFVVDGQWIADPLAAETVPDPFGGRNSVLRVCSTPEATHLAEAEHIPPKTQTRQTL